MRHFWAIALLLGAAPAAQAYLGPGMGAGAIGVALGILGSILLALFAVVYYPVKRLLKRRKAQKPENNATLSDSAAVEQKPDQPE